MTSLHQEIELGTPDIEELQIKFRLLEMEATELQTLNQDALNQTLEAGAEEDAFAPEDDETSENPSKFLREKSQRGSIDK